MLRLVYHDGKELFGPLFGPQLESHPTTVTEAAQGSAYR